MRILINSIKFIPKKFKYFATKMNLKLYLNLLIHQQYNLNMCLFMFFRIMISKNQKIYLVNQKWYRFSAHSSIIMKKLKQITNLFVKNYFQNLINFDLTSKRSINYAIFLKILNFLIFSIREMKFIYQNQFRKLNFHTYKN